MKNIGLLTIALVAGSAAADLTNPFTEDFNAGANNWLGGGFLPPTDFSTGGVGDSGYIGAETGFEFSDPGGFNVVFRGNTGLLPGTDASGGNFFGDWISNGVTEFSFSIRHDIPVPVTVFARIAANSFGSAFPGAVAVNFAPVAAGEWTEVSFDISADNPAFVTFEGSTFESIFSNVGFLQIGVTAPDALLGDPTLYDVGLDNVSIVPAPASLLGLAPIALAARRRR